MAKYGQLIQLIRFYEYFYNFTKPLSIWLDVDLKWDINSEEIKALTKSVIDETTKRCDKIAATQELTHNNILIVVFNFSIQI